MKDWDVKVEQVSTGYYFVRADTADEAEDTVRNAILHGIGPDSGWDVTEKGRIVETSVSND